MAFKWTLRKCLVGYMPCMTQVWLRKSEHIGIYEPLAVLCLQQFLEAAALLGLAQLAHGLHAALERSLGLYELSVHQAQSFHEFSMHCMLYRRKHITYITYLRYISFLQFHSWPFVTQHVGCCMLKAERQKSPGCSLPSPSLVGTEKASAFRVGQIQLVLNLQQLHSSEK